MPVVGQSKSKEHDVGAGVGDPVGILVGLLVVGVLVGVAVVGLLVGV